MKFTAASTGPSGTPAMLPFPSNNSFEASALEAPEYYVNQ